MQRTLLVVFGAVLVLILSMVAGGVAGDFVSGAGLGADTAEISNSTGLSDGDLSLVKLGAESRAIITKRFQGASLVCAEPAPDVGQSALHAAQLLTKGAAETPTAGGAELEVGLNAKQVKSVQALLQRSQGLQNMRDILFRACEAYINGAIDRPSYTAIYKQAMHTTTIVMGIELIAYGNLPSAQTELLGGAGSLPSVTLGISSGTDRYRCLWRRPA